MKNKNKSGCSSSFKEKERNLKDHWNRTYSLSKEENLGWYEKDLSPTIKLISETGLEKTARIINVGSGSTTLIDELLKIGYSSIIATDLSDIALGKLEERVGKSNIQFIVDDLTNPSDLIDLPLVDLWIDRAVLHFIIDKDDQDTYFELLNNLVKPGGFVLLAEYNLNGAKKCAGLPVYRYSIEMLIEKLDCNFDLINSFDYTFIMPSGKERPYIYALFRKKIVRSNNSYQHK